MLYTKRNLFLESLVQWISKIGYRKEVASTGYYRLAAKHKRYPKLKNVK